MIEHLLRTTHEQSRKYEALKATMDRNENLEMVGNSTNGYIPVTPGVNAAMMRSEVPNNSKTEKLLEAPEADPATTTLDHYCTLIQQLMTEVEAKEYNIGRDMRCRIRDDVINTHKREMRLRAVHGHEELGERMREKYWPLVEMAEERAEERQQSQEGRRLESSSGATFAPTEDSGPQELDLDPKLWSQAGATQSRVRGYEGPLAKVPKAAMDPNPQIELFLRLNKREDPWNHFHLLSEAPMVESPRAPEENGWLPYWISGVSKLAFHRILPLNSLKPHIRDDHTSTMPFFRSGTSMLVTDKSHIQETIASSQDLAALTDSTDTDTFVSARSEIGELALDTTHDPCFVEGEEDGPLVVLGDQGDHDTIGKDRGELGVANATPSLNELPAAWVDVV